VTKPRWKLRFEHFARDFAAFSGAEGKIVAACAGMGCHIRAEASVALFCA
jgi:hypothetical protein